MATLYRHILGRQPDREGQRAFAQLAQCSGSPNAVVDRILNSREYNERFGDWGVPGSGGVRFCAPSNAASSSQTTSDERFEFLDTNNNGRIEPREWHPIAAAFNRLDTNHDNRLSRREFAALASAGATPPLR